MPVGIGIAIAKMILLTQKTPHFLGRETRDCFSVMGKKSSVMREGRKATEQSRSIQKCGPHCKVNPRVFKKSLAEKPGPGDPIFFDPDSDAPPAAADS